ncbi:hypothetical protein AVEN_217088-1 [Araneus ventricosus]|uniref:Uncharacterized protein n=1 Tax=Araneus ventricosus TaxID=182803 RepID=A0A4Y2MMW7_ARAVE|nr:hypothetical protein AVEN_217088-1 [Araneus ventricosus]
MNLIYEAPLQWPFPTCGNRHQSPTTLNVLLINHNARGWPSLETLPIPEAEKVSLQSSTGEPPVVSPPVAHLCVSSMDFLIKLVNFMGFPFLIDPRRRRIGQEKVGRFPNSSECGRIVLCLPEDVSNSGMTERKIMVYLRCTR